MKPTTSMGQFISVLRRAKGMTQQQLADALHVSNKAVSRWERDESFPDLALVPVIADMLGVTADELLRGHKNAADDPNAGLSDKSIHQLADSAIAKYTARSLICAGLYVVGLCAAMVCNFAFTRGLLGFFIGCAVFVITAVCQVSFCVSAFGSLLPRCAQQRERIFSITALSVCGGVIALAFCLPLLASGAHTGVTFPYWLANGTGCALIAAIFCAVVYHFADQAAQRRGLYTLSQDRQSLRAQNLSLQKSCLMALIYGLVLVFCAHMFFDLVATPTAFAEPIVFYDIDSFKQFIETPTGDGPQLDTDTAFFDEYGNEIPAEEALKTTIRDSKGNIVGHYLHKNEQVTRISYSWNDDQVIFTSYTTDSVQKGFQTMNTVRGVIISLYFVWSTTVFAAYWILKKRNTASSNNK